MKPQRRVLLAMTWESPNVQRGVLIYAKEHQWQLEISSPEDLELIRHWRGNGIICTMLRPGTHPMPDILLAKRLPIVEMTKSYTGKAEVLEDNTVVGQMAADYFLNKGFRHFLCVTRSRPVWSTDERFAAFQTALAKRGLKSAEWYFDEWHCPNRLVERMGARLLKLPKPLAVFCGFDNFSYLILNACLNAHLPVPEAVAILGTGNEELRSDWALVPLSRIQAYTERQGYEAASLLDRILDRSADPTTRMLVPPGPLIERASTATVAIHDPSIHQALEYIKAHLHQPITVVDVARHAGMSRSTLVRKFRLEFNRGIVEEINRRRIEEAKKLMLTPEAKAHLIGASLGFASPYYFYRVFRKLTGQTTRQYRAQHSSAIPPWTPSSAAAPSP